MSDRQEGEILRIIAENWAVNGVGTPKEDIVRQAAACGVDEEAGFERIEHLRKRGEVYQIRPGLLVPVEKTGLYGGDCHVV